jgi:hypothetical protein
MVDRKELDELSKIWPVHGMQFQYSTGKWNCSVVELTHSSPTIDETTVVLRFDLVPDDSTRQETLQRHLTLTFADFKSIRDVSTALRYATGLHTAILDFLCSEAVSDTRRV